MRLRNISGSKEVIAASPYVIQDPRAYKGRWSELFHNSHPIRIEVGMGTVSDGNGEKKPADQLYRYRNV